MFLPLTLRKGHSLVCLPDSLLIISNFLSIWLSLLITRWPNYWLTHQLPHIFFWFIALADQPNMTKYLSNCPTGRLGVGLVCRLIAVRPSFSVRASTARGCQSVKLVQLFFVVFACNAFAYHLCHSSRTVLFYCHSFTFGINDTLPFHLFSVASASSPIFFVSHCFSPFSIF